MQAEPILYYPAISVLEISMHTHDTRLVEPVFISTTSELSFTIMEPPHAFDPTSETIFNFWNFVFSFGGSPSQHSAGKRPNPCFETKTVPTCSPIQSISFSGPGELGLYDEYKVRRLPAISSPEVLHYQVAEKWIRRVMPRLRVHQAIGKS